MDANSTTQAIRNHEPALLYRQPLLHPLFNRGLVRSVVFARIRLITKSPLVAPSTMGDQSSMRVVSCWDLISGRDLFVNFRRPQF